MQRDLIPNLHEVKYVWRPMGWQGALMGIGTVAAVLGIVVVIAGAVVAVAGPEAVDDQNDGSTDSGASVGPLSLGADGGNDRSEERNEVRAAGGVVMGLGAALVLVGGALYAVGRAALPNQTVQTQQQTIYLQPK